MSLASMPDWTNRRATEQARRAARVRNSNNPDGTKKVRYIDPTTTEVDYTPDEVEFLNAVQDYKDRTGRKFPTYREILGIARTLGYQKVGWSA